LSGYQEPKIPNISVMQFNAKIFRIGILKLAFHVNLIALAQLIWDVIQSLVELLKPSTNWIVDSKFVLIAQLVAPYALSEVA